MNIEKDIKIMEETEVEYRKDLEKYWRNASWIFNWYGKYSRNVSWIVKREGKSGRKLGWIVKR